NKSFAYFTKVFADSGLMLLFSPDSGLQVSGLNNGLPREILYSFKPDFPASSIFYSDRVLYLSTSDGIKIYKVGADSVTFIRDIRGPGPIFLWEKTGGDLIVSDESGNLYKADSLSGFSLLGNAGFVPSSIALKDEIMYLSFVKRSRLLSIWDPYIPSNYVRLSLWKAGWKIFLDHPVFGVGDIDLAFLYKQYKSKYEKEIQGHMHNNFVHILVTLGLFGLLAFCFLLYSLFKMDYRIFNEMKGVPFASSYALGAIAALGAVIIAGLTEMNFFDHEVITLVWFTFGLNVAIFKRYQIKDS
ncbi:MAG TPA: O-antigen ligase family protein, partial [Ignavibacteriaceae bacterium]